MDKSSKQAETFFLPIERRAPLSSAAGELEPPRIQHLEVPRPRLLPSARSFFRWTRALLTTRLLQALPLLSPETKRARLRARLQRMGPVANKIAAQFAYRLDVIPAYLAFELSSTLDAAEPIPLEQVISLVEDAIGAPIHEYFQTFDPTPLGSRTIRLTYMARRHDDTVVVVQICRPGVRQALIDELTGLRVLLSTLEFFTIVRPGRFRYLHREISHVLLEATDFRAKSRAHSVMRKQVRKARLKFVDVPEIYRACCNESVTIHRFEEGYPLGEILAVVEEGNQEALARLADHGICPQKVARSLLKFAWWEIQENLFYLADPTPMDILVVPGGQLVPIHFTDCAATSGRTQRLMMEIYRSLENDDVSSTTRLLIQLLEPLPFIDVHSFSKLVEARIWQQLFAFRDKESQWWERTSTGIWMALLDITRRHGIAVHQDVVRVVRSLMLYEAMAVRLDPRLNALKQFRVYRRQAERRIAKKYIRDRQRDAEHQNASLISRLSEASELIRRTLLRARFAIEDLPVNTIAMPRKAAYITMVLLYSMLIIVAVYLITTTGLMVVQAMRGTLVDFQHTARAVLAHPVFQIFIVLNIALAVRRLLFRLSDMDQE